LFLVVLQRMVMEYDYLNVQKMSTVQMQVNLMAVAIDTPVDLEI